MRQTKIKGHFTKYLAQTLQKCQQHEKVEKAREMFCTKEE